MSGDRLESEAIDLVCFLAVSARELMSDPKYYGPMRLMEATQRLVEMIENSGVRHELLAEVSERIEAFPFEALPESEEDFVRFMDDLLMLLATWVSQH